MQNSLISEFAAQNTKSGLIGGYCEDGFPLYYANLEMAEMLGYNSIDEFAAAVKYRYQLHDKSLELIC